MREPMLFETPRQPRVTRPEPRPLYAIIAALRAQGFIVVRAGRNGHIVRKKAGRALRFDHDGLRRFAATTTRGLG
jgi:hypothetical protein